MADFSGFKSDPKRAANQPASGIFGSSGREQAADSRDGDFAAGKLRKRGGGGKLSRSETVTVRLDPKLRYLAELAARKQRRTLSSFIEWAIEESLKSIPLDGGGKSIAELSAQLWDVDEPDRFVRLALNHPAMLTYDEQVRLKLIEEYESILHYHKIGVSINYGRLREHWSTFKKVARGDLPKSALPDPDDERALPDPDDERALPDPDDERALPDPDDESPF